jgi:hypothetical protein
MKKGIYNLIFITAFLFVVNASYAQTNLNQEKFCKSFQSIFNYTLTHQYFCDSLYYAGHGNQCPDLADELKLYGENYHFNGLDMLEFVMYSTFDEVEVQAMLYAYKELVENCLPEGWTFEEMFYVRRIFYTNHNGIRDPNGNVSVTYNKRGDVYEISIVFMK